MSAFLIATLLWTGALLALVLLIRRPVARHFGARAAYALWALPMARLLLPPLVLPAWMAPVPQAAMGTGLGTTGDPAVADGAVSFIADGSRAVAQPRFEPGTDAFDSVMAFDWATLLFALWLAGAAVFLVRRYTLYFRMRRSLLQGARPVGESGRIRMVETPAADGPVAFGVIDKVIALAPGFMGGHDRAARDLALAHELAHHRGHDLLCNMLVQPLFAIHWFNPLSALGWRALRRDQEAACDARVMAHSSRESRAAYAAVIARFATEPRHASRLALAAPMACPVLGDHSIVQRLKSLSMTDISARRRWSGRLLLGAAALALPLTGSISYAQDELAPDAVEPPLPPEAPAVVAGPTAPPVITEADGKRRIVRIERRRSSANGENLQIDRNVLDDEGAAMSAEDRADLARDMAQLHKDLEENLGENSEFQRDLRRQLGANDEMQREIRLVVADAAKARALAQSEAMTRAREAMASAPRVTMQCRQGQREVAETVTSSGGRQQIFVCNSLATADARRAIELARNEISRSRDLTQRQRTEAMRSLDEAERAVRAD